MKKLTNVLIAAFVMSFLIAGQAMAHCGKCGLGDKDNAGWLDAKMEKMTKNLELSDEQAAEIRAIMEEKMEKKSAIKADKMDKIEAVKEEYSAKIKAVLNDEQNAKYEEMKADKGSMKGSDHDHKGSGHDKMEKGSMDEGSGDSE